MQVCASMRKYMQEYISTQSEFKNELNENKVQFARKTSISFYVSFKGFCYIYKKSFYFEIDIERNLHFCPQFWQTVPYSRPTS